MKPTIVVQTGTGSSSPVPMNLGVNPFNVGMGVVVTGTVAYTVQYTFDDVWDINYNAATGNWFDHPALLSQSGNMSGNFAFPVSAIRLTINSGTGTAVLTIIQSGVA